MKSDGPVAAGRMCLPEVGRVRFPFARAPLNKTGARGRRPRTLQRCPPPQNHFVRLFEQLRLPIGRPPWISKRKRNATYLSHRVDVDVVLGVLRVWHKRLDQERPQDALDGLDLLRLARPRLDPLARLGPCLVQGQQAALASPLDELVWLRHELRTGGQQPRVRGLGLVEHALDVCVGREVQRRKLGRRVVCGRRRQRRRLDDGRAGEVVVEDGLAVGLEDRLGGHGEGCGCGCWSV